MHHEAGWSGSRWVCARGGRQKHGAGNEAICESLPSHLRFSSAHSRHGSAWLWMDCVTCLARLNRRHTSCRPLHLTDLCMLSHLGRFQLVQAATELSIITFITAVQVRQVVRQLVVVPE